MAETISRVRMQAPRVRMVNQEGMITPEWFRWFETQLRAQQNTEQAQISDDTSVASGSIGGQAVLDAELRTVANNPGPAPQELGEIIKAKNSGYRISAGGTATLVAGAVTVANGAVRTQSLIMLSRNTSGGTLGYLSAPAASIVNGVSFGINSSSALDTSTVNWVILGPIN